MSYKLMFLLIGFITAVINGVLLFVLIKTARRLRPQKESYEKRTLIFDMTQNKNVYCNTTVMLDNESETASYE